MINFSHFKSIKENVGSIFTRANIAKTLLNVKDRVFQSVIRYKYEWFLFLGFSVANIILSSLYKVPTSYPDEFGVLSAANYFSGGPEWGIDSIYHGEAAYYGYTSSILIAFLFRLFDDIQIIYFGVLVIKSLLISLVPVLCYKILHKIFEIKETVAKVLLSCTIGLYPVLTLYSKRSCNETMLHLSMFLCFYFMGMCAIEQRTVYVKVYSSLLAFFAVFAYATHGMGLSFVVAVCLVVAIVHVIRKKALVSYTFFIGSLLFAYFIDKGIKKLLMDRVYHSSESGMKNTFAYSFNRMIKAFTSWDQVVVFLKSVMSKLHYVASSTYGMFLLVSVLFLYMCYRSYREYRSYNKIEKERFRSRLAATHILILFAFILPVCGIFLVTANHIQVLQSKDAFYIYGRYYEYMVLPLIMFGLSYIFCKVYSKKRVLVSAGVSFGIYIALSIFTQITIVHRLNEKGHQIKPQHNYGVLPFTGRLFSIGRAPSNTGYDILTLGIVSMLVFFALVFLFLKKHRKTALIALSAMFIVVTGADLRITSLPLTNSNYKTYYAPLIPVLEKFKDIDDLYYKLNPKLYIIGNIKDSITADQRAQLLFNKYKITKYMSEHQWKANPEIISDNSIILSNKDLELEKTDSAYIKIYASEGVAIWTKGKEIQNYCQEKELFGVSSASIPLSQHQREYLGHRFSNSL